MAKYLTKVYLSKSLALVARVVLIIISILSLETIYFTLELGETQNYKSYRAGTSVYDAYLMKHSAIVFISIYFALFGIRTKK